MQSSSAKRFLIILFTFLAIVNLSYFAAKHKVESHNTNHQSSECVICHLSNSLSGIEGESIAFSVAMVLTAFFALYSLRTVQPFILSLSESCPRAPPLSDL